MDADKPNPGGPSLDGGAGKKKNKKSRQQNAPRDQQSSDNVQVKVPQQQIKTHEQPAIQQQELSKSETKHNLPKGKKSAKSDVPPKTEHIVPQTNPNQKQPTQKQPKGTLPSKTVEESQKQSKGKSVVSPKSEHTAPQTNPKPKQLTQKQPKGTLPSKTVEESQKQPKGAVQSKKLPAQAQGDQQIEQQIHIFKSQLSIPKRKNQKIGGTLGRATEVEVNHLPLNLGKLFKKTVYHIDVQFTPDVPKKLLRNALEEFNRIHYPKVNFAFDGRRNMYTTCDLKGKADTVTIINEENCRTMEFNIATSVVNVITMDKIEEYLKNGSSYSPPGEAFQALDIILKNRPFALRFTNVGRSFFPVPLNTPTDLGEGMELWKGFFQSPVMGWKPYLNIDVAHKGFPKHQPLLDYIKFDLGVDLKYGMDSRQLIALESYVKGLKVDFIIPNQPNTKRSYKVVGLLNTAEKFFFEMDDASSTQKKEINVVFYYQKVRNYKIQYPHLPCLHVGNINKKTAIPIELCTVQKGQVRMKKLTDNQTSVMVKNAARPPAERRQTIESSIKMIKYNEDPVLKEFGIEVGEKFACVPARVLDQPSLAYAHKETKPRSGVWRAEKLSKAVQLSKWVVLNLDQRTNIGSIKEFERCLINSGKELNVVVSPLSYLENVTTQRSWNLDMYKKVVSANLIKYKGSMDLIIVVIPDSPSGVYATIKQVAELEVGILTQCIKSRTMFRMNTSTSNNILLKINSKLNGINHTLAARSKPATMNGAIIFGADVTHPSPDQINIPSIAAVAASHDLDGSQYNMEWRLQSPKVEIIADLENIVHLQLNKFKERTKTVPKKIIYFRDGVSEGQFLQLLEHELVAIRRACMRLNINYKPAVTFLVVQKRHHTRMFPKHHMDMDGKFGNVPSGTIIDTQITHPTELDFYLCSHASIQGMSRPTKYHLIWDDNSFTEDQLEQLTFYMCFMFARCTRSVSYPAPTYYAHLAAFRARAYIENKQININRLNDAQDNNRLNPLFTVNTPMFFT